MRRRGIPYVVKGLNRLFDSPEIRPSSGSSATWPARSRRRDLRVTVERREPCSRERRLGGGDGACSTRARLRPRRAVGRLQHPAPLPRVPRGARAARRDRPRRPGARRARLLPARQVQPGDLRLRADLLQHRAGAEVRVVRELARAPGARLLRRVRRRRRLCHARRGHALDGAPGQGHAVAGGLRPVPAEQPFPSKRQGGLGLFHVIPDSAIADADRYRGTVEDETRLFYVAVTRAQKYLFVSFSPGANQLYRKRSLFFDHCAEPAVVLDPGHRRAGRRAAARAAGPARDAATSRSRSPS